MIPNPNQPVSTDAAEMLLMHARRIQHPQVARTVWQQLLTDEERARLGAFESAYQGGRTIGLFARAKSVSGELAVVQITRALGLPDAEYFWLLRELGAPPRSTPMDSRELHWNRERGELYACGEVIRVVKRIGQAVNIVTILDAFEEEGWPARIDDPLPGADSERLAQAVRRLNESLVHIRFRRDGTGEGIVWVQID